VGTLMKVRVDQSLCTDDGLCDETAPVIFILGEDGLSYVTEVGGAGGKAAVLRVLVEDVMQGALKNPGDCIHVES
jgi:ferredoxin